MIRRAVAVLVSCALYAHAAAGDRPRLPGEGDGDDPEGQAMGRRLQEALRAHGADVHGCYGVALAARPGLSGEILFRIVVLPDGKVARAEALKDQVGYVGLTECLTSSMQRWSLPRLAGSEPQQFVFPLAFHPDENDARATGAGTSGAPYVFPASDGKPGPQPGAKIVARVLVSPATVGKTQASLTLLQFAPSTRQALHSHPNTLEILYVLKGRAHLRGPDGVPDPAEAGDAIVMPPGVAHNVEAAPLAPLELVQIFAPAGPEAAYLDPKSPAARALTVPAKKSKVTPTGGLATIRPKVIHGGELRALPILGGKGTVALFLDGYLDGKASLERLEVDAGAKIATHQHDASDELLYVVSGRATMTIAGRTLTIGPGDAIHIPMKTPHALDVTEKLVAVQSYAPAGPEQRFKGTPK